MAEYSNKSLTIEKFYPANLVLKDSQIGDNEMHLSFHTDTTSCNCPKCGISNTKIHTTHHRKVQDLPILGKRVYLDIKLYEFDCQNPECAVVSFTETLDKFLNSYSSMTERLVDLMVTLAMETSCEGAARILKSMNVKTSGDTVIRTLIKRYEQQPKSQCGSVIGIDDFSFKKRFSYGTIIVDEESHKPVAILDGRDGDTLKEWLKNNKHVKTVTRDRASAYAKAVEEILPDCMQVADRFHLHQNLLEAINKVLNREIPATTAVESKNKECVSCNENKSTRKKIVPIVDNLTATEEKRLQQIKQIQKLHQSGVSIREITKQLQINRHTVRKYLNGKPEILCRSNKRSSLDKYKSFIIECLQSGNTQMETVRKVSEQGCSCSTSNIRQYIYNVIKQYQIDVKKYVSSSSDIKFKKSNKKIEHITRKGIFQYLWMNGELTKEHHECLWNKYEVLTELESCILEFREIFELKKMPLLYLFIDRYKNSSIKELASFANGLSKDIDAVENAVASELSNGFVEGTNSKLKMIKRTMYGRCSRKLLEAKLMCNLNAS